MSWCEISLGSVACGVVRAGCAGVDDEDRGSVSLAGSAPQGYKNIPLQKGTIGLAARGFLECARRFSFAEMKGGLGQKGEGRGRGHIQKRIWLRYTSTPGRAGSSGLKPTSFPGSEIIQRQISPSTRGRRRQRSTGKDWSIPASRERADSSESRLI
jgi:hypothetical protein